MSLDVMIIIHFELPKNLHVTRYTMFVQGFGKFRVKRKTN